MKINKTSLILVLLIFFQSCNSLENVGKVMRNEKIKTTDEFLIKKRAPLTLPPKFGELPKPGSQEEQKKDKIKEIFDISKSENKNNSKGSSVEKSIINKIGK